MEQNNQESRALCIIAHVDHGKTTLSDALVQRSGLSNKANALDRARPDQIERNITIKSTGAALRFDSLLVNLIDSPGHVDFSSEVSAALRMSDGCFLVVDCASGLKVQTRTTLKQALAEAVLPVLVLNKLDRLLVELRLSPEEMYLRCQAIVDEINDIIVSCSPFPRLLSPVDGTVLFSSGKQSWGFSLPQLAKSAAKTGANEAALLSAMWGDMFFNTATGKWSKSGGPGRVRGFCKLVAEPLTRAYLAVHENASDAASIVSDAWFTPLGLSGSVTPSNPGATMKSCLALADILVETIRDKLPSPQEAQKNRAPLLYPTASEEDPVFAGIRNCDPNGPLLVYIAKMTPVESGNGFWAFGRILSGTLTRTSKVHILPPEFSYSPDASVQPGVYSNVSVQRLAVPRGASAEAVDELKAGNLVLIGGIDKYISRTATLVSSSLPLAAVQAVSGMKLKVSPVVAQSVRPKKASDQAAFSKALVQLGKTDSLVSIAFDSQNQQTVIAGAGELHLEVIISDLKQLCGFELVIGDPEVTLRETVIGKCDSSLAKSASKLNRIFLGARPADASLVAACEEGRDIPALVNSHPHWALQERKRIWKAGGEVGPNVLYDATHGSEFLNEAQSTIVSTFAKVAMCGPLVNGDLQGVIVEVKDVKLHADRSHRSDVPEAVRRAVYGSILQAEPRLLEPILLASIEVSLDKKADVFAFLFRKQSRVVSETLQGGSAVIEAHLPALESLGFDAALRKATSGAAFCSLSFSHYAIIDSDPLEPGTRANKLLVEKRAAKGLPPLDPSAFIDKL